MQLHVAERRRSCCSTPRLLQHPAPAPCTRPPCQWHASQPTSCPPPSRRPAAGVPSSRWLQPVFLLGGGPGQVSGSHVGQRGCLAGLLWLLGLGGSCCGQGGGRLEPCGAGADCWLVLCVLEGGLAGCGPAGRRGAPRDGFAWRRHRGEARGDGGSDWGGGGRPQGAGMTGRDEGEVTWGRGLHRICSGRGQYRGSFGWPWIIRAVGGSQQAPRFWLAMRRCTWIGYWRDAGQPVFCEPRRPGWCGRGGADLVGEVPGWRVATGAILTFAQPSWHSNSSCSLWAGQRWPGGCTSKTPTHTPAWRSGSSGLRAFHIHPAA